MKYQLPWGAEPNGTRRGTRKPDKESIHDGRTSMTGTQKSKTAGWLTRLSGNLGLPKPAWLARMRHPYPEQFSAELDFPTYTATPRLYLIATTPRCGSHFLGHALHATGQFGFPLEYLNRMNLDIWRARLKAADDGSALRALLHIRTSPSGWFGLKAHWNQFSAFDTTALFSTIPEPEKAIWIYRRNLLAQSISRCIAERTGQWISGAKRRGEPSYNPADILRNARLIRNQNLKWQAFFTSAPDIPLLKVVYEDLLADQKGQFEAIGLFLDPALGSAPQTPEKTRKQGGDLAKTWAARFKAEMTEDQAWIVEPQGF
jgi:trehalose 2-sulfotransferase